MECIRDLVDYRYHRLILKDLPDLCALLSNQSLQLGKTGPNHLFGTFLIAQLITFLIYSNLQTRQI